MFGNKVKKARQGHVMEDIECQAEEVKHDVINTTIHEKKNLEISQVSVCKMSLMSSTVLYYGTYLVTVGMSVVSAGCESSGRLRQSAVHRESGALGLNFLFGTNLLLDMVKSLYESNPPPCSHL